ncbi:hypothetical protein ACFL5O_06175 [Myxococcota bacterium]
MTPPRRFSDPWNPSHDEVVAWAFDDDALRWNCAATVLRNSRNADRLERF